MTERNTRIKASQIKSIMPSDIEETNSPSTYDVPAKTDGADTFTWVPGMHHTKGQVDFTLYSDASAETGEKFKFYEHSIDFNNDRAIYINDDGTFIGHGTGDNIVAGINNTLVGHYAGQANNFSNCCFLGHNAGKNNIGNNNISIGTYAMYKTKNGFRNTVIGQRSLYNNINGDHNVAIGRHALYNCTHNCNTAIGTYAGYMQALVGRCVFIGYRAGYFNTTSHRLMINANGSAYPLIYGEFDNDVVKFGNNSDDWNIQFIQSCMHMKETTTPTAIANFGAIYCKVDNKLYYQDGTGTEHEVAFV